jgi:ABC-2 type transport system ATP-binding protein
MDAVKRYCNKAILINNGKIVTAGNPVTVSNQYSKLSYELDRAEKNDEAGEYPVGLSEQVSSMKVQLVSESVVKNSDKLVFDVKYKIHDDTPCFVGISILKGSVSIIEHTTIGTPTQKAGSYSFRYEYALGELRNGEYQITGVLFKYNKDDLRERQLLGFTGDLRAANFSVVDSGTGGLLVNRGKWTRK